MLKNMKLGTKLITMGTLIMLIPLVVVGFVAMNKSTTALEASAYGQMAGTTKALAEGINNVLKGEMNLVKELSIGNVTIKAATAVVEKGVENSKEEIAALNRKVTIFNNTKGLGEKCQGVIVMSPEGVVYSSSKKNFIGVHAADRDYFRTAMSGVVNIGKPTLNKVTGKAMAVVAAPIYSENGKVIGTIANFLDIGFLVDLIANTKIGKTGYAFMVDKTGLMIAHPVKKYIFNMNITRLKGMESVSNKITSGQSGVEGYIFEGIKTCGYAPVESTGWSVVLTQLDEELLAPVRAVRNIVLIVGIIFFMAAFVIFFFFARSITKAINRVTHGLADGADQVAAASGQVSSSSQSLAEGAAEQAASIEETSSSLEEMSSMTKQNADNAQQADGLMREANQVIVRANESMHDLTVSMQEISTANEETYKIIKTIDEIAFQTNLLALNAAVEAARAGEHGAGFAVVAEEVRNLAMRSADAAKNTSELIEGTVKKTKDGSELVSKTNGAFSEVSTSAVKVGELVAEIAAASNEQSQGIGQVNIAVTEMDKVVQQNAANAEESASASEEMNAQAEQMKLFVGDLVVLVGGSGNGNGNRAGNEKYAINVEREAYGKKIGAGVRKILAAPANRTVGSEVAVHGVRKVSSDQIIPMEEGDFKDF